MRWPSSGHRATDLDRRTFIKGVMAASGAMVVAPTDLSGDLALQQGVAWRKVPCRMCGVGCGLLVGIQGGRAVAVKGDPESPVSRGTACVKGYYAIQALYGRDRITRALVRRNGALAPVSMNEAFDLVATRMADTIARHGPDSVAVYGSGQWTAADAFVAARLFRGAIGTRNVDTSARLQTASADAGLLGTFGRAGAVGGYEDLDHGDVFVLWNINMAETDPVLFSRILERRRTNPAVRIIDLSTRTTRTSYASDRSLLFAPQAELSLANAICHEIVARGMARRSFVDRHVAFKRGQTDIGSSLSSDTLLPDEGTEADWDDFVGFLDGYTPARAEQVSGVAAADIRWLASLYGDPARRVVSAWGAAVNRHSRGTWLNNALHNIHLLVGKIATPGNAAISLSGQPGGAALVNDILGTSGVAVDTVGRERLARARGVPVDRLDDRPGRPALSIFQALESGDIRFLWIQAGNPMVSLPNLRRYRASLRQPDRFVVVSEAYPTPTTDAANVVLPAAMWFERDGEYVNAERRVQKFTRLVAPPGDGMSDARQMIEVARRLGHAALFEWDGPDQAAVWEELTRFHDEASRTLPSQTALRDGATLRWPAPRDRETGRRYHTAFDPAADPEHGEFDFYGHPDHRAWIWLRPYEPPPEAPDRQYPFWFSSGRVVEHWGTGSMTRRVPTLHRAVPHAYAEIHGDDARPLGIRNGDVVRLTSRRGSVELEARIDYRGQPPRGRIFAPEFDEGAAVNLLSVDAGCPLSGQPDNTCAVRIERVRSRT
ncbi:MAG TPA: molybdopterin-dependent oxidoreductase [Gemmatimonadaceae bacterium]